MRSAAGHKWQHLTHRARVANWGMDENEAPFTRSTTQILHSASATLSHLVSFTTNHSKPCPRGKKYTTCIHIQPPVKDCQPHDADGAGQLKNAGG